MYGIPFLLTLEVATRLDQAIEYGAPVLGRYTYESRLYTLDQYGLTGRPHGHYEKWSLNAMGFRGPEIDSLPPEGVVRVVCLGASETFGLYETPGKEWPRQLEGLLRARGYGVEVVNVALAGMTLESRVEHFRRRIARLKPDIVVLMLEYASYGGVRDNVQRDTNSALDRAATTLTSKSGAWELQLRVVRKMKDALFPRLPAVIRAPVHDLQVRFKLYRIRRALGQRFQSARQVSDAQVRAYSADVERFVAAARAQGVRVMLVAPALRIDEETVLDLAANWALIDDNWLVEAKGRFYDVTWQMAIARRVPLLDLDPLIAPHRREWMADAFHFTDAGAKVVADAVAQGLRPLFQEAGEAALEREVAAGVAPSAAARGEGGRGFPRATRDH